MLLLCQLYLSAISSLEALDSMQKHRLLQRNLLILHAMQCILQGDVTLLTQARLLGINSILVTPN